MYVSSGLKLDSRSIQFLSFVYLLENPLFANAKTKVQICTVSVQLISAFVFTT